MTTFKDVIAYVTNEATAEEASALFTAANSRQRALRAATAAENIASLKPDTRVRTGGLKPKYLNGLTGSVVAIEGSNIRVKLDNVDLAGRYANRLDGTILAPASTLTEI